MTMANPLQQQFSKPLAVGEGVVQHAAVGTTMEADENLAPPVFFGKVWRAYTDTLGAAGEYQPLAASARLLRYERASSMPCSGLRVQAVWPPGLLHCHATCADNAGHSTSGLCRLRWLCS